MVKRILAEINYASEINKYANNKHQQIINQAIGHLAAAFTKNGTITNETALAAEACLLPLAADAKAKTMIMVAHAHIDMNWLWGFDETVAITISTLETMLDLLDAFPEFTFSQSQAAIYQIIATYRPDLLARIKKMVKSGRWEVTASTWVEGDKNMATGDSLARSILYAKTYLADLLEINSDELVIDYEPDTFGHSENYPEILAKAKVKYYYHCRGKEMPALYNWIAKTNNGVLAYCEPFWYNGEVNPDFALFVPDFCNRYGIDYTMRVYGVGDHGGGATVKDILTIKEMMNYPVFPRIVFGSYRQFFEQAEKRKDSFRYYNGELNPVFTGCYTSQAKIKQGNANTIRLLYEAEVFNVMADLKGVYDYQKALLNESWHKVLFNQFHDILPGSGVEKTKAFALANYQLALAASGSVKSQSLRKIIDTFSFQNYNENTSFGAGSGFQSQAGIFISNRAVGSTRHFVVFNPFAFAFSKPVRIQVWDYEGDREKLGFYDYEDNLLEASIIRQTKTYWSHDYFEADVHIRVSPFGFSYFAMRQLPLIVEAMTYPPLFEKQAPSTDLELENNLLKIELDTNDLKIIKITDKITEVVIAEGIDAGFNYVIEDGSGLMSSWKTGRHLSSLPLHSVRVIENVHNNNRSQIIYTARYGQSNLEITAKLDFDSTIVEYLIKSDCRELGEHGKTIPKLEFGFSHQEAVSAKYMVPYGICERTWAETDMPGNELAYVPKGDLGLVLIAEGKHAFRFTKDKLKVSLLRASFDPDPTPEIGIHEFRVAFGIAPNDNVKLVAIAQIFLHKPIYCTLSEKPENNLLPIIKYHGGAILNGIKKSEDGKAISFRLYDVNGTDSTVTLEIPVQIKQAYLSDILENKNQLITHFGNKLTYKLHKFEVVTIRLEI